MPASPLRVLRRRREARLEALEHYRAARRLAAEDVTVLGEQLSALHVETLTDELTEPMRDDYAAALTAYDDAKAALDVAATADDVARVATLLLDGRFLLARVLARRDGRDLPRRREACFFNPQHGPATRDVDWTPPGGVPRPVAVCFHCSERLTAGEPPDHRMVRVGDRWVRWHDLGRTPAEVAGVQAHVIRGTAWQSRVNEAEALTRAAVNRPDSWGSGSG